MNLKKKLITYFVIIIISFIVIFFSLIQFFFIRNSKNKVKDLIEVQSENYAKVFNKKLNFIKLFVQQSSHNNIFWEQLINNDDMIKKMSLNSLKKIIKKHDKLISNIVLIDKNKEIVNKVGDKENYSIFKTYLPNLDIEQPIFFEDFIFRDSNGNYYIIFSNPVKKYGQIDGAFVVILNLNQFFKDLEIDNKSHLNIVFTEKGKILYHKNYSLILNNIQNFIEKDNGYFKYINKNDKVMIGKKIDLENNWQLLTLTEKDFIYSSVKKGILITIILSIITIIFGIYLSYKFSNSISDPILRLVNTIKKIIKENEYDIQLKSDRMDEIGTLFHGFNRLVENIKHHIEIEGILNEISEYFIFASDKIENELNYSMGILGDYFNLDRISLYLLKNSKFNLLQSWSNPGLDIKNKLNKEVYLESESVFMKQLIKTHMIEITDLKNSNKEITNEIAKLFDHKSNKSILITKLYYKDKISGILVVESNSGMYWDKEEKTLFSTVSEIFINSIMRKQAESDLKELNERLEEKVKKRTEELNTLNLQLKNNVKILKEEQKAGRKIQFNLLPKQNLRVDNYLFSRVILPSLYLSGDFIDYKKLNDKYCIFYLADISGHGVASAFITILLKNIIEHYVQRYEQNDDKTIIKPEKIINKINENINSFNLDKYLVIFFGVLDLKNNDLIYINAGQNPAPTIISSSTNIKLKPKNLPVGLFNFADYSVQKVKLPEKFSLVAWSDGILEIMKAKNKRDMIDKKIQDKCNLDTKIDDLINIFDIQSNKEIPDDIAILMIKKND